METRRWRLFVPLAAITSIFAGCAGSTANVQNPPAPPSSTVSITFQPTPPTSVTVGATTPIAAVVTHDSSNTGVDWSLTCSIPGTAPNKCGTLSALHTDSAESTLYTAPSAFSGNSVAVNIQAFATADHTQNVGAPITVTGFGSVLKGTYVLQAQGIDVNTFGPYQFAGVVVFDGNGGITSGEQTVNFFDANVGALLSKSDSVVGGSYFLGPDGRGTITVNTNDQDIGQSGIETFACVVLSSSQALITQTDFTDSASGTMDLQTNPAAPSGGYAFVVSGTDIATASPTAIGGVFNIDSTRTISGNGSVADQDLAGSLTSKQALSGTVSNPDSFGGITVNLNVPGFPSATIFKFTGYIVDATHIKLIESDNDSGSGSGATGGVAIGQGSATGTFLDDSSFSGTYVFGVLGQDLSAFSPSTLTSVGVFSANGSGGIANGFTDTFLQANGTQGTAGSQISAAFIGAYTIDSKGTGRVRANFKHFVPAPQLGFAPVFFVYLTGNGNPPLILYAGDFSANQGYPSLGTGIAYVQSSAPLTFDGQYGFSLVQQNGGTENDATAAIAAHSDAGTLSGTLDNNSGFNPTFNSPVSGTLVAPASNGRFAGTLDSLAFDSTPFTAEYYIIDPAHGFFVETDLVNPNSPTGVVSFGYYAARTPLCADCP